jgi:beta-glucanase (GH16 family)
MSTTVDRFGRVGAVALALAVAACSDPGTGAKATTEPPLVPVVWKLVWSDEFDGPAGAPVDATKWVAEVGGGGWGNQEREYYTNRPENASLDGAGHLVITARAESPGSGFMCWYGACQYTSARLTTKGKLAQSHGKFEARIRIPRGQGIWPAFWMLGADIDLVGWPQSGEIDVMENIGREPSIIHGTIHGPGYSGGNGIGGSHTLASGSFADDYHVFAIEWFMFDIRWFVDGQEYRRVARNAIPSSSTWVFDHPFFLLLNVAVGGQWPGDPDATTQFPQQMLVDYVRVYAE